MAARQAGHYGILLVTFVTDAAAFNARRRSMRRQSGHHGMLFVLVISRIRVTVMTHAAAFMIMKS